MSAEHDDALAEDEAFARVEERDRDRLARRLEAVRQYRFTRGEPWAVRAALSGDAAVGAEIRVVARQLRDQARRLEAIARAVEGVGR